MRNNFPVMGSQSSRTKLCWITCWQKADIKANKKLAFSTWQLRLHSIVLLVIIDTTGPEKEHFTLECFVGRTVICLWESLIFRLCNYSDTKRPNEVKGKRERVWEHAALCSPPPSVANPVSLSDGTQSDLGGNRTLQDSHALTTTH